MRGRLEDKDERKLYNRLREENKGETEGKKGEKEKEGSTVAILSAFTP